MDIYTDGSCIGNPGPGGWAALVKADGRALKISDSHPDTTNNRMELTAAIWGLKLAISEFPNAASYKVHSDSSWVVKTMTDNWKRKKNLDLWEQLTPLLPGRNVQWQWVKGHAGHPENEQVDDMAQAKAREAARAR